MSVHREEQAKLAAAASNGYHLLEDLPEPQTPCGMKIAETERVLFEALDRLEEERAFIGNRDHHTVRIRSFEFIEGV